MITLIADEGYDHEDEGGARRGLEESGKGERQLSQRGVLCEENPGKVGSSQRCDVDDDYGRVCADDEGEDEGEDNDDDDQDDWEGTERGGGRVPTGGG